MAFIATWSSFKKLRKWKASHHKEEFFIATVLALAWTILSIWLSRAWMIDLEQLTNPFFAIFALTFIAYLPGFMNVFLLSSLIEQPTNLLQGPNLYPPLTIIIAAFEEEAVIAETLYSLRNVNYDGLIEVIVVDDGSQDRTISVAQESAEAFALLDRFAFRLLKLEVNGGKAEALNRALEAAQNELIITIDADTTLEPDSIALLVNRLQAAPIDTVAIAGTVLVANPNESLIAGAQQWDYLHGIAAVKRMQGMYGSTLVAQGAFSIYERRAILEVGGWPNCVGEDIVLTWALLKQGYHIGYAENAIAWTKVPKTARGLAHQRKRWARGMIEALSKHTELLFHFRLRTMFIWWNLLFIMLDTTFALLFLPGLALALFGVFWVAGPITLLVLPLAAMWNLVIYRMQLKMLRAQSIQMERSRSGFLFYIIAYPLLMQPISLWGYLLEFAGGKKQWGRA
jgi:biofilm PGA synthesis N-glycosyltransferase PgaC